ncbi:MAG TPA: 4-hydroxy-tetrahydrodipicolinate synthase [Bacteroidales bacterium]|nr:4-hydroxy-tetrahydrodipicolinate synthase [Bacteroidales bacterium]
MKKFTGMGVAMVTPFKNDCSIDFKSLERVTNHILEGAADFLVLLGTTSEAVTLSCEEKDAVVSYVKEINNNRIPIVVGFGGNNTQQVVNSIKNADFDGVDGILSVAPYYNKPGQKGLYQHFKAVASASPVPVILYNVPGRTSSNISSATCTRLAWDFENIVAVKEASGNFTQVMEIIRDTPDDFLVISGDDLIALPMISLGGSGVISVLGNSFPAEWSEMVGLALKGKFKQASEIHYKFLEMICLLFEDGNPAGVKSVLSQLGICMNSVRLPLTIASRSTHSRITVLLDDLKLK